MKIGATVLVLWLNKSFGLNYPKSSFQTSDPWVKVYFNILGVHQIFLQILDKKSICLRKLEEGFWTYGFVSLLGPIGPNLVVRPQNLG